MPGSTTQELRVPQLLEVALPAGYQAFDCVDR
jgi:hypothetical protein